jgi:hypothetical protein
MRSVFVCSCLCYNLYVPCRILFSKAWLADKFWPHDIHVLLYNKCTGYVNKQTRNTKIKHEQTNSDLVTYILLLYNTFTFVHVNKHRLVKHAHEVSWWTCDCLFCLNLGVCLQVYIYRSWGQNLSAHVYVIICMCLAEFYLVCNSCIRCY